jgi:hypothetical protein
LVSILVLSIAAIQSKPETRSFCQKQKQVAQCAQAQGAMSKEKAHTQRNLRFAFCLPSFLLICCHITAPVALDLLGWNQGPLKKKSTAQAQGGNLPV